MYVSDGPLRATPRPRPRSARPRGRRRRTPPRGARRRSARSLRNSRLFTTVTVTPAAVSRANAVGCGCHSTGSTFLSQNSALSSVSVPGTREVKPTRPCGAGSQAGAEGGRGWSRSSTARRRCRPPARPSSAERNGAAWAWRRSSSAPRPSTRNTTYDGAGGQRRAGRSSPIELPSAAATAGTTSPSERWWYAGSTKPPVERSPRSGSGRTATRRTTSSPPTASPPSAAAETRSEKSSEASTPV